MELLNGTRGLGTKCCKQPEVWARYQRDQRVWELATGGTRNSKTAVGETMAWETHLHVFICARWRPEDSGQAGGVRPVTGKTCTSLCVSEQQQLEWGCRSHRLVHLGTASGKTWVSRSWQIEHLNSSTGAIHGVYMHRCFPLKHSHPDQPEGETEWGHWRCLCFCQLYVFCRCWSVQPAMCTCVLCACGPHLLSSLLAAAGDTQLQ